MKTLLKRMAARLPRQTRQNLKRAYFGRQIRRDRFGTDEPEFARLAQWIKPGDWVLDIGANIGHYTLRFAQLVGPAGRVISFEPIDDTFELLTANAARRGATNISFFNAAVSETAAVAKMEMPRFSDGLDNYYMAKLSANGSGQEVLCVSIDSLGLPGKVRVAKIDVEGHELAALKGMKQLLERDRPMLIVEDNSPEVGKYLAEFGYSDEKIAGSCNRIFRWRDGPPD